MAGTPAEERLKSITGGGGSPEVPPEILARDAEILGVGQVGLRVSKYGCAGLELLFKRTGEYVKSPTLEKYSPYVGRGIGATIAIIALLMLRGRTTRLLAFGATWENLTWGIDWIEEQVRKAVGV